MMHNRIFGPAAAFGACSVWLACGLSACGQSAGPQPPESSASSTDALNGVLGCQADAFACAADAQALPANIACQDALRSCLLSLLPDAALVPTLPTPPTLPTQPTLPPLPPLPTFDAGFPTRPTLPNPPAPPAFDAGPAPTGLPPQAQCLASTQACLASGTMPSSCATTAQACLTAAAQTLCDEQEKACLAGGLPQALCDAQRKACR
jgi:hypothetical protein